MKRPSLAPLGPPLVFCFLLLGYAHAATAPSTRRQRTSGRPRTEAARTRAKLQQIVIPRIAFEEASVADVIRHLVKLSKQYDPDKKGVNIMLLPGPRTPARNVAARRAQQTEGESLFDTFDTAADGATQAGSSATAVGGGTERPPSAQQAE